METLPPEILDIILLHLSIEDVLNLGRTKKYFNKKIKYESNLLWKHIFHKTFPTFTDIECSDWFKEVEYIFTLKKRIHKLLRLVTTDVNNYNDITYWTNLLYETSNNFMYIRYFLLEIMQTVVKINSPEYEHSQIYGNRTIQYCAANVYNSLRKKHFLKNYVAWTYIPENRQFYEDLLFMIAEYLQPYESLSHKQMCTYLDNFVENVLKMLVNESDIYNAIQIKNNFIYWSKYKLERSNWSYKQMTKIVDVIDTVLQNIKIADHKDSSQLLIDKVLQNNCGSRIAVLFIKQAIGRRLGINFSIRKMNGTYYLIYNDIEGVYYNEEHKLVPAPVDITDTKTVCAGLVNFLYHYRKDCVLFLFKLLVFSEKDTCCEAYSSNSFHRDFTGTNIILDFKTSNFWDLGPIKSKLFRELECIHYRPANLKYAVGMIMDNESYKCIIVGWYYVQECKYNKLVQPIYNVLNEDGSTSIELEENLKPSTYSISLDKVENIGLYFSHYFGNHYVPNLILERAYPEDKYVRMKFYRDSWEYFANN